MPRLLTVLALTTALIGLAALGQDPNSANPKERKRAAEDLARQGVAAIPRLQKLLSDTDLEVRIAAVKSLVEINTHHSLDPLIQATRDNDPEMQIRATDGLVNFYLPGYVRTGFTASLRRAGSRISGRFTERDDQVVDAHIEARADVIEALGRLVRGGSSMESRANAARAAGVLRGRAAVPDLLTAIRSKDSQVIFECLIALQKIRDQRAGPQVSFLLRDLDQKVQIAAIETAGLLYNQEALPRLRQLLSESKVRDVRRAALRSIAMLRDPADRDLLKTYLRDRDEEMREAAAEGLGRIANPEDRAIVEQSFAEEKKSSPRVSLAFALVMLGQTDLSEFSPLQYLVNTLNSAVRVGEARALLIEAARKTEVRRALEQPLMRGTSSERFFLAQVMAVSGDSATVPLLDQLSKDADVKVAEEAVRAIRAIQARTR